MKKTLSWLLSAVLLVALAAEGTAAPSQEKKDASSGGLKALKAEITVWCFPVYEGYDKLMGPALQENLNKTYPNIKVNCELQSWDTGPEKITVAYASGATPDVLLDGISRVMPAISKGLCVPVDDVLGKLTDTIIPEYRNPVVVNGKNYYVPVYSSNGYNISVNKALAKKLGVYDLLPADKVHWSYDQFLAFCRAARAKGKAGDVYPTQLWAGSRSSDSAYFSFLMSAGSSILDKEHTKCLINDDNAVKAFTVLQTLIKEDLVPMGAATAKDSDASIAFYSGKLVMNMASAGAQTAVYTMDKVKKGEFKKDDIEVEVFMFPTPDGKTDPKTVNWGPYGFSLFKNKNNEDKIAASKLYAEEILGNLMYIKTICKAIGNVPATKVGTVDFGDPWVNGQFELANGWSTRFSTSGMGILEPWWTQVREVFFPEMQALYVNEKTPKQALDSFAAKTDAIIAKESKK